MQSIAGNFAQGPFRVQRFVTRIDRSAQCYRKLDRDHRDTVLSRLSSDRQLIEKLPCFLKSSMRSIALKERGVLGTGSYKLQHMGREGRREEDFLIDFVLHGS